MKKILVPIDGSNASIKAAEKAIELAKKFDSTITFISVALKPEIDAYHLHGIQVNPDYHSFKNTIVEYEAKLLENVLNKINLEGVTFDKKLVQGEPYEEIVKAATDLECDLIVMGRRGFSKIKRFFVGSVTQRVISDAPCQVLVVKED